LTEAGRTLLAAHPFTKKDHQDDYKLGIISKACLQGPTGASAAEQLCQRLKDAVAKHETHAIYHDDLLCGIFGAQPLTALNALCAGDETQLRRGIRIITGAGRRKNPLGLVADEDLLRWCDEAPNIRYPALAQAIKIVQRVNDKAPLEWTMIARRFLDQAPDPREVLKAYVAQFTPNGWSGSLAAILESHVPLLEELAMHPALATIVTEERALFVKYIAQEKDREARTAKNRDERFE
jgi:hypothetical protein